MKKNQEQTIKSLPAYKWCIAFLKGKEGSFRFTGLFDAYRKHHYVNGIDTAEKLRSALLLYPHFFFFEDFNYDYVLFEEDDDEGSDVVELAKDVLRSHQNRYTLGVLLRKMEEADNNLTIHLDEPSLKDILSNYDCFEIEKRSFEICKLTEEGMNFDIEPVRYTRRIKSEEERAREAEEKKRRVEERLKKQEARALREEAKKLAKQKRKLEREKALRKRRSILKEKSITIKFIEDYHITNLTQLQMLLSYNLITKSAAYQCNQYQLYTLEDVFQWAIKGGMKKYKPKYIKGMMRIIRFAIFSHPDIDIENLDVDSFI